MCQDTVFRKPMPVMCMRSQYRETLLYLSGMPLGKFDTMIGYTFWILWRTVLPFKCVTLGPYMSSDIPTYYRKIGRSCSMLLSTVCRIRFTRWPVMCFNRLAIPALFTSQEVYCFLSSTNYGMGEHGSFTMMCTFLFLIRYLILWYKRPALIILKVGCCGIWTTNSFPSWLL